MIELQSKIGTMIIRHRRTVVEERECSICVLRNPTRSGSTHVGISETGEVVALMSLDGEGKLLVDTLFTGGELKGLYLDTA